MLDKREAVAELVEDRLPLFTADIRRKLDSMFKGPARPTNEGIMELVKAFPDHFAGLIYRYTQGFDIDFKFVWVNTEINTEYHDVDVEVVRRYIIIGRKLFSHYMSRPREQFIAKCERYAARKRARDAEKAILDDQDRFFSLPFTAISSERWASLMALPCLTAEQCATLALGRNPDEVTIQKAESAVGDGHSAFLNAYRRQIMFFERLADVQGTQASNVKTSDFLKWARQEGLPFALVGIKPSLQRELADDLELKETSLPAVHSLYKVMYGLALMAFPSLSKSMKERADDTNFKGTTKISRDLEEYLEPTLIGVDDKTIDKYLLRAYWFLRKNGFEAASVKSEK